MKKINSLLLALTILFSCFSGSPSFAAGSTENFELSLKNTSLSEPVIETAPLNPEFLESGQSDPAGSFSPSDDRDISGTGYTPSPVSLSGLSRPAEKLLLRASGSELPATYDLREEGQVTYVKDQGQTGSCWAFSSLESLESYILGTEGENRDFSENNMKNLVTKYYSDGFDLTVNDGGNAFMSMAYLARWSGPVNDSEDPFSETSTYSPTGLPVQKHVQEALILPERTGPLDNEVIKEALMDYGAVYSTMYWSSLYYRENNYAYLYAGSSNVNHAITIVGWNDSFDRNMFKQVPSGDGAFIVKNSWGEAWGEEGYFYISYYDTRLAYKENAVFTAAEKDNFDCIYQYDPLGWITSFGYPGYLTAWGGNIFSSGENEKLEAIGFYTTDLDTAYEIYVYKNPTNGPFNQERNFVVKENGTCSLPGYHTHLLNSPVDLTSGEKFSVVIKFSNPSLLYPLAIELPLSGYSSKAQANSGESYVSSDGVNWQDLTSEAGCSEANLCIKAFTTVTPLSILSANPGGDIMTYEGEEQEFSISTNHNSNVNWYLNGVIKRSDSDVKNSSYSNSALSPGNYTVTARAVTGSEMVIHTWNWTVFDWNPWDDSTSQEGTNISTVELQEAIHVYKNSLPVPNTGVELTSSRLEELIRLWREGSAN